MIVKVAVQNKSKNGSSDVGATLGVKVILTSVSGGGGGAPVLKDNYITGDDNYSIIVGTTWFGQTFTPTTTFDLSSVKILCRKVGVPSLVMSIYNTGTAGYYQNVPVGLPIASQDVDCSAWSHADFVWEEAVLTTPLHLVAGTIYALTFHTKDAQGQIIWRVDATDSQYVGGEWIQSYDSGVSWTPSSAFSGNPKYDFLFSLYGVAAGLSDSVLMDNDEVFTANEIKTYPFTLTAGLLTAEVYDPSNVLLVTHNAQVENLTPTPTVGSISITSNKNNTAITIDDGTPSTYTGTPIVVTNVPAGSHTVKGTLSGYTDDIQTVTVVAGASVSVTLNMVTTPPVLTNGTIIVTANKTGTHIYLDNIITDYGPYSGSAINIINVPVGTHTIKGTLSGYTDDVQTVVIATGGETKNVALNMVVIPPVITTGQINVTSNVVGTHITLDSDGVDYGTYNGSAVVITGVPAGSHVVKGTLTGYQDASVTVTVVVNTTVNAPLNMVSNSTMFVQDIVFSRIDANTLGVSIKVIDSEGAGAFEVSVVNTPTIHDSLGIRPAGTTQILTDYDGFANYTINVNPVYQSWDGTKMVSTTRPVSSVDIVVNALDSSTRAVFGLPVLTWDNTKGITTKSTVWPIA